MTDDTSKTRAVVRDFALSDFVAKVMYVSLTVAAIVFVAMLLLVGAHP